MDKPSELVEILHSNMEDATAEVIQQVVSGEVPVVNVEVPAIEKERDIPLFTDELGPEPTNSISSTLREPDELKFARLDFPDEYLDLIHASASHSVEKDQAENQDNWLEEHMEDLKNHFIEELTTIQQEVNRPFTIDDEGSVEEESIFMPPCFDDAEEENCESRESMDDKPLFDGASITVGVSILLILTVAIRHSLTGEALNDILCLINLHCLSPNLCPKSLFQLKRHFHNVTNPIVYHYFCAGCLEKINDKTKTKVCPNMMCLRDLRSVGGLCFCLEIPLITQLQALFTRPKFFNLLDHRFKRSNRPNVIEDIYDGELYREHFEHENSLLRDKRNLSFTYNTDGVPLFKSSKFSLWPLYFAINELPCPQRFQKENMILAGLWYGERKPLMLNFLKPFHTALSKLETDGMEAKSPSGEIFISKAILLLGTCDMPAKCMVCNSTQFNGFYGCLKCKQPGCTVKTSRGGNVHAFPFLSSDPTGPARTHEQTREDAREAFEKRGIVDGIKGPCWFAALKYHDLIRGSAVDYMHCVLEGVMKLLLKLWFGGGHSDANFTIANRIFEVDKRLAEIKPPNNISRCPRSIENHSKYWKASELRSFLLFYGAVVLNGILPDAWYEHFMLLSEAIFLLSMEEITHVQLVHAENLIEHFCVTFAELYGIRFQTANIHYLLHIPQDVRNLGPLWTHSCFPFENCNGEMLKLFHGTQNVPFQIASAILIMQHLPQLENQLPKSSRQEEFYKKVTSPHVCTSETEIEQGIFAIGGVQQKKVDEATYCALADYFGHVPEVTTGIRVFLRMRRGSDVYHSKDYKRVKCRNSYTIKYVSDKNEISYAQVIFFFQVQTPEVCTPTVQNLALVTPLQKKAATLIQDCITGARTSHIQVTEKPNEDKVQVIPVSCILEKCVYIDVTDFPDRSFVIPFPNRCEKD